MTDAMRAHAHARLSALRMLKAALVNREVEKGRRLEEAEARQVVSSLVKQRRDSIEQFTKGNRPDLVEKEQAEIVVLEAYLPRGADPATVERAVAEAIRETGATSPKDLGRVMKAAMAKLSGQNVDGKSVNELARKLLEGRS
jgi:uncharacterized protein YqeY